MRLVVFASLNNVISHTLKREPGFKHRQIFWFKKVNLRPVKTNVKV